MEKNRRKKLLFLVFVFCFMVGIAALSYGEETGEPVFRLVEPGEAYDFIQKNRDNPGLIILDVRTPGEYNGGHLEDALNIDFYSEQFRDDMDKLDKDKTYVIYCRSGTRSGMTFNLMKELGFQKVYDVNGGILKWLQENYPVVKH